MAGGRATTYGSLNAHVNVGAFSALTIGTTPTEGMVGPTPLLGRQMIVFQPKANGIFYGFDATVTTATGVEVFRDNLVALMVGPNFRIWFVATANGKDLRFQELA